ncbi:MULTISPECIES: hypothetical protein [unclassified Moorena]|uniref:hypothetical protein n=1 Tax=unclassified Moorena TaxID=2683338 RepID=UPI0013B777AF|nr:MULTISPECIES: hypothetical protein [unclassified Moorena]NEQ17572.1 hypothetical protein [Moorena sp. SIO3E2]NER88675.1 hypothetical protein [Moorena sp. SIO3A2]NES46092.1 hypothetical protein [Moorena sp. SIO2C4]
MAQALALAFWPFGHATRTATRARMATLCERRCEVTQHYSNAYLFYSKADSTSSSVRVAH